MFSTKSKPTVKSCSLHRYHRPRALTAEDHHVIPRAWQSFWIPAGKIAHIWDPRTVTLCPTSHRNVHVWIVRFMHAGMPKHVVGREAKIAALALTRWEEAGGSLEALREAGLWGEA